MALIPYIENGEAVDDIVSNRPLKGVIEQSGLDPDADFIGFLTQLLLQQNSAAVGNGIKTLNFLNSTLTPNGTVMDILNNTPRRATATITTAALAFEAVETGVVALGALSVLLRAQCSGAAWVRLYSTAADRTADSARLITDDPTTPIIADFIFGGSESFDLYPQLLSLNLDQPAVDNIYYSIQQLEGSGATGTLFMSDAQPSPGSSDIDVQGALITNPLSSGATAWEYNNTIGTQPNTLVWNTYGGIRGGLYSNAQRMRIAGGVFDHSSLIITASLYNMAIDTGAGPQVEIIAHMPTTAINSYLGESCLLARIRRSGSGAGDIELVSVDGAGAETIIDSTVDVPFALSSQRSLVLEIISGTATVYLTDTSGLNPVAYATGSVPVGISANTAIGASVQGPYQGWQLVSYQVADSPVADLPVVVNLTRTVLEEY